jgi:predicted enzyme related to lactoylglutathione lyase
LSPAVLDHALDGAAAIIAPPPRECCRTSPMDLRICIDVDDLGRALAFYTQGLGLRPGRRLGDDWAEVLGGTSPIDLLRNAAGTAPLGEDRPDRRGYQRHWTPVHLDFVVTDIDACVRRLVAAGGVLERPIQQRRWGRMANLADPFGHGIDLLEFQGRGYDEILDPGR